MSQSYSTRHEEKSNSIPKKTYDRHINRAKSSDSYFHFYRHYVHVLGRIPALFVQDLTDLLSSPNTPKKEIDGRIYCMCTATFLENSILKWTKEEQKYHFHHLNSKEYIDIRRIGVGGRRWIYIDHAKIEGDIDKVLQKQDDLGRGKNPPTEGGKTPQQKGEKPPNPYKQTERTKPNTFCQASPEQGESDNNHSFNGKSPHLVNGAIPHKRHKHIVKKNPFSANGKKPVEEELAIEFKRIMVDHRTLFDPRLPKTWAKDFRDMLLTYTESEIREGLVYHDKYIDDEFWPQLTTVKTFHQQFKRIQNAMKKKKREEGQSANEPSKVEYHERNGTVVKKLRYS